MFQGMGYSSLPVIALVYDPIFMKKTIVSIQLHMGGMTAFLSESAHLVFLFLIVLFSSPEHKVLRVSYCDRPLSVVVRRPSCVIRKLFYLNIFSSETTHWILSTLHRNYPWVVPYQSCSNGSDWLHK